MSRMVSVIQRVRTFALITQTNHTILYKQEQDGFRNLACVLFELRLHSLLT